MTRRDEHLWDEEVVEIFLDPDRSGRDYYELEINPANVVCDLRMISPWPDKKGDIDWNLAGLETRVHAAEERRRDARAGRRPRSCRGAGCAAALRGARRAAPEARRRLALQRVPHRAARGPRRAPRRTPCSRPGRPRRCRASTRRGLPRPRLRRARRDRGAAVTEGAARPRLPRHDGGRPRGRPAPLAARAAGTRRSRTGGSCSPSARGSSASPSWTGASWPPAAPCATATRSRGSA